MRSVGSLLLHNRSLLWRKLKARAVSLTSLPPGPVIGRVEGLEFEFDFEIGHEMAYLYRGWIEFETEDIMRAHLASGDTFIDVGANVGYYSALGAGLVGTAGQVHSFEPVKKYYERLKFMAERNPAFTIVHNPLALGDQSRIEKIAEAKPRNSGFNSLVPGLLPTDLIAKEDEVQVVRLDDYILENRLGRIALIKIDAEGYEFPILRGMSRFFEATSERPPIISEVIPDAFPLLGERLEHLVDLMSSYGYGVFDPARPSHRLDLMRIDLPPLMGINVLFSQDI